MSHITTLLSINQPLNLIFKAIGEVYADLRDLSIFQEQVQKSKGYHQFCSQMLRQSDLFFSHKTSAEYLTEHRHDSPEAQQKYDEQFGLMLRNA